MKIYKLPTKLHKKEREAEDANEVNTRAGPYE